VVVQVPDQFVEQVRWDGYGALARGGFRVPGDELPRQAHHGAAHGDGGGLEVEVEVGAGEPGELTEAQAAPGGEQHHRAEPFGHGGHDGFELGQGRDGDLAHRSGVAGPADPARVGADQVVGDRGVADRAQQAVGARPPGRVGRVQGRVPGTH